MSALDDPVETPQQDDPLADFVDDPEQPDPLVNLERIALLTSMQGLIKAVREAPAYTDRIDAAKAILSSYGRAQKREEKPMLPPPTQTPAGPTIVIGGDIASNLLQGFGRTLALAGAQDVSPQTPARPEVKVEGIS